ncbi:MAG: ATP-binding protein, partial [Cytophagaceae bacterium]
TSQDITFLVEAREDLMRSEEELEDSRKFINRIAEASPFIIYVYDIPEKKIVYMNRELLQMLGYKKGESNELEPGFFKSLLHPDDLIKLPDWMTRYSLLKDGETLETEFRMKHKNDSWRFICTRETVFKRGMTYAPIQILGIGQDITERKQNEEERTNLKLQQQKDILNAMLKTQEDERKRIAESLHNGLGQLLYGAKIKIETLANLLNKTKQDTSFLWVEVNDLIDEAINTTRTISFELTPAILEDFGVEVALKELCKKLTSEKLRLTCEVYDLTARLDNSLETAIFRISQELINNIIKHSEATEGLIKIENKKGYIAVVARDNGKGFDTLVHNEGQGLRNIKNRVKLLNGQIKIESELNKGTTITINLFQL